MIARRTWEIAIVFDPRPDPRVPWRAYSIRDGEARGCSFNCRTPASAFNRARVWCECAEHPRGWPLLLAISRVRFGSLFLDPRIGERAIRARDLDTIAAALRDLDPQVQLNRH